MFAFTDRVSCKNKSKGTNSCKYIILHHTWSKNYKGEIRVLSWQTALKVSCHFLVWPDGQTAKIGDPSDIQWHVWVSERGNEKRIGNSLNHCCLWIEITWPLEDGWFSDAQKHTTKILVEHLMSVFWIPKENVLRHCDVTHPWSKNKQFWKIWTVWRKRDVAHTFFPKWDFLAWRKKLVPLAQ